MKVIQNITAPNIRTYLENANKAGKPKAAAGAPSQAEASSRDTVVLSSQAREIQALRGQLDSIPDVREAKVAALKDRIADGTYTIDSGKAAEKMLDEALVDELV